MTLFLYNTLRQKKELFTPLTPPHVGMYVCGPTVYDWPHIGNARPVVVFDVLFRLLQRDYTVTYVRNITDIDDKIIQAAHEKGVSIDHITQTTIQAYQQDMRALGASPPTHEPRATECIPEMIALIQHLVDKKHAYVAQDHVLFNVASDPIYGCLSRCSKEDRLAGARVDIAPYKLNPEDFVLWKPSVLDQPGWESPWGRGRPGWHIECSAMSHRFLGPTFDIHGGGQDLIFPHHENEIAQSTMAFGPDTFARFWLHNGHLLSKGQKCLNL